MVLMFLFAKIRNNTFQLIELFAQEDESGPESDPVFDFQLVHRGIPPKVLKRRFTMSITRRQFLLGMASTSAGLVVPTYLTRANQFLEETGQPLLIPPKRIVAELYGVDSSIIKA